MKISVYALCAFLALHSPTNAFTGPQFSHRRRVDVITSSSSLLQSMTAPVPPGKSSTSEDDEEDMVSSGKILEGGKVIDFESVKGPSRAEQALLNAKWELSSANASSLSSSSTDSTGILGINDEVIAEVGHELAKFATPEEIQGCASYLRSMAPAGLLESKGSQTNGESTSSTPSFSDSEIARYNEILDKAFVESGEVTEAFAKTFYMGTQLLPDGPRKAIWAVYVWCRRTDEIVDAPRPNDDGSNTEMLRDLGSWETRLENLWKYGDVEDVFDLCLLDVLVKYPPLPITPFMDMVRGMLMDVPNLGQEVYDTFDELHLYCYRVAGTVGLMSLPIFGCAEGYDEATAK